jgi:hypothetical protein
VTTQQARVVIRREGGFWRDTIRRYKVRLDGERIGMLRPDEQLSIELEPGSHEVQIKLDWGSSPRRIVELAPGEVAWLRCGPGSVLGLLVPDHYLVLEGDDRSTRLGHADRQDDHWDDVWESDPSNS